MTKFELDKIDDLGSVLFADGMFIRNYISSIRDGGSIDNRIIDFCRNNFPSQKINIGNGLFVSRVNRLEEVVPYLEGVVDIFNKHLPSTNRRVSIAEDFAPIFKKLSNGNTVDLGETWKGNSFLLFEGERLVGANIGRRENLVNEGKGTYTKRGFLPLVVVEPELQGTDKSIFFTTLTAVSLIQSGVEELRGSCAVINKRVDKFYSRFSTDRQEDGDYIRYVFDTLKIMALFERMKRSAQIPDADWKMLVE